MTPTRRSLIEFAIANLEHRTARRALLEGSVEFLGGFAHVYPGGGHGWIIKVKGHRTWYICVKPAQMSFDLFTFTVPSPDWKYWDGDKSENKLYQGDRPELYRRLKCILQHR